MLKIRRNIDLFLGFNGLKSCFSRIHLTRELAEVAS